MGFEDILLLVIVGIIIYGFISNDSDKVYEDEIRFSVSNKSIINNIIKIPCFNASIYDIDLFKKSRLKCIIFEGNTWFNYNELKNINFTNFQVINQ